MPGQKAAAPKSEKDKGAAARREAADEEHKVDFRGMELTLPPKLRESVIWRFGVLRETDIAGTARLVQAVIGTQQYQQVLDKLDEDEVYIGESDSGDETSPMVILLRDALASYGLEPGESPASNGS